MVTRRDYTGDAVAACRSVLIELAHTLGEFRQHLVVVGGWVPILLVGDAKEPHTGTLDIDLAIDFENMPDITYQTIMTALERRGYRKDPEQPFRFFRAVELLKGRKVEVEVDLLAGEYGGTAATHRTQRVQDIRARKARGCDLAFSSPVEVTLKGTLPDGGLDQVTLRVAAIAPWLVMKGMALHDRIKEKDAYDIYYVLRHYPGGVEALAEAIRSDVNGRLAKEGLGKIRAKFGSMEDVGPKWVADFLEITDPEERAIRIRDAYETVSLLLDKLGIKPWAGI